MLLCYASSVTIEANHKKHSRSVAPTMWNANHKMFVGRRQSIFLLGSPRVGRHLPLFSNNSGFYVCICITESPGSCLGYCLLAICKACGNRI